MPESATDRLRWVISGALFAVALAVGFELARPFRSASIAFDAQVAVLHFDRIAAGLQFESFVSATSKTLLTTPKPLLTLVYGALHAITGDWRSIAWATILAYALAVAGAGIVASRAAGPAAGAFSGLAVLAAPTLLFDVGLALATPWALLGWVGASLALTGERPRYALAGASLALASLARFETLVMIGVAMVALSVAATSHRSPPRRAWLVPLVGAAALPVMCFHDWLLTGDPLFWSSVAQRYSQATTVHVLGPLEVVGLLASRYADFGAVTVLAVVGLWRLFEARRFALAVGLVAMGPGVASFLVLLAIRGIFVSDRYLASVDIAVLGAAGVGAAGLSLDVARNMAARWADRLPGGRSTLAAGVGAVAALILAWPHGVLDASVRAPIRASLAAAVNADRAVPILRAHLEPQSSGNGPVILVPTSIRPRLIVDLGLPLSAVQGTDDLRVGPSADVPRPGQLVYHDPRAERRPMALQVFEIDRATTFDGLTLEPLITDATHRLWVVTVH